MKKNSKPYIISGLIVVVVILALLIQKNQRSNNPEQPGPSSQKRIAQNSRDKDKSSSLLKQGDLLHRLGQNHKANLVNSTKENEEAEKRRMEAWKANFPYKPTYHPNLRLNLERYDPNNPATFRNDPEMQMAVKNHGFMELFFKNPQIYSAEFEQLYHLLEEVDRAENPKITALIFTQLLEYHKIMAKHDLNELWSKKELVPSGDGLGTLVEKMVPIDGKTTWGEQAYSHIASIVGLLVRPKHWPDKPLLDADEARAFRDRLVNEIPSANFVTMPYVVYLANGDSGAFGYDHDAEKNLKSGDRLLMVTQGN